MTGKRKNLYSQFPDTRAPTIHDRALTFYKFFYLVQSISSIMTEVENNSAMVCHYEVMQLEMNCKAEEIKKQYKVLALKYHPDRNHGKEEEATVKFKQVAAAYAVLNDPHERKWYDDHREAILRGGNGTAQDGEDADDSINVWKYFNATCFTGFNDESPIGFYTVYRSIFDQISERESDKTKSDPTLKYATITLSFGTSTTPIADVLRFYLEWENFASKLNFAWADMYHTVDAPNRATRRVMEKENTKARDQARKEYTNQIRSLARFVKKRDPRYTAYEADVMKRKQEAEEMKKNQKLEEMKIRKEKREKNKEEYEKDTVELENRDNERKGAYLLADVDSDDENCQMIGRANSDDERELQKSLKKVTLDDFIPGGSGREVEEGGGECVYACSICEKVFKNEVQLAQHNTSKPHKKKVTEHAKAAKKAGGSVSKEKADA